MWNWNWNKPFEPSALTEPEEILICIANDTEQSRQELMELLESYGVMWRSDKRPTEANVGVYQGEIAYYINMNKEMQYGTVSHFDSLHKYDGLPRYTFFGSNQGESDFEVATDSEIANLFA